MEAFLLVEHSHHDPEARYSLYDADNFDKVQDILDSEGWLNESVPELELDGKRASFGSVFTLLAAIRKYQITIVDETNSWMDHD